jgi:hypothetical protein
LDFLIGSEKGYEFPESNIRAPSLEFVLRAIFLLLASSIYPPKFIINGTETEAIESKRVSFFLSPTANTDKIHTIVHSPFSVCKVATTVLQRTEHNNGVLFLKVMKQSKAGEFLPFKTAFTDSELSYTHLSECILSQQHVLSITYDNSESERACLSTVKVHVKL